MRGDSDLQSPKPDKLTFHEITSLDDCLLLPWLDIYETSFPPPERVLVSSFLARLKGKQRGQDQDNHMLAALAADGTLVAIADFGIDAEHSLAAAHYLAVAPSARGGGVGTRVHHEVLRRAEEAGARGMVMEVEDPERCDDPDFSRVRIEFYRRNGAKLLRGVNYLQRVGSHQPPLPMLLMVHPLGEAQVSPDEAYRLAKLMFGDDLTRTGELSLE